MSSDIPSSSNQAQSRKHSLDFSGNGNERAVKLAHTPSTNRSSVPANSPLWALTRQLQLRLQYARLKVEHGWQKQSLNEVENLYFRHHHQMQMQRQIYRRPQQVRNADGTFAPASTAPVASGHAPQVKRTEVVQSTPTATVTQVTAPAVAAAEGASTPRSTTDLTQIVRETREVPEEQTSGNEQRGTTDAAATEDPSLDLDAEGEVVSDLEAEDEEDMQVAAKDTSSWRTHEEAAGKSQSHSQATATALQSSKSASSSSVLTSPITLASPTPGTSVHTTPTSFSLKFKGEPTSPSPNPLTMQGAGKFRSYMPAQGAPAQSGYQPSPLPSSVGGGTFMNSSNAFVVSMPGAGGVAPSPSASSSNTSATPAQGPMASLTYDAFWSSHASPYGSRFSYRNTANIQVPTGAPAVGAAAYASLAVADHANVTRPEVPTPNWPPRTGGGKTATKPSEPPEKS